MSKKATGMEARKRVGMYVRISSDRDDSELGVKRQEKEARAYVKRKGWKLVEVYIDNDISADKGSVRPSWLRLLEDIEAGKIDTIVGWSIDRLTRQPIELELVIELAEKHGITIGTVSGDLDLNTPMGRLCARMLVAYAKSELEQRRARQLAERLQAAEDGKVHMGGKRPFGYLADKITIDETEAVHIRDAAERVLAGESLRGICLDFEERGIRGTSGRPLQVISLKKILVSARISGRRELWQGGKGEARPILATIVKDDADWEGIISVEDSDALRALLTQKARRSTVTNARRHLLPGFLECSTCERPMRSHQAGPRGAQSYVCAIDDIPEGIKCRKQISAEGAEGVVISRVLSQVQNERFLKMIHKRAGVDPKLVKQLAEDLDERDEIARQKARKEITPSEWKVWREELTARIDAADALIKKAMRAEALVKLLEEDGTPIEDRWQGLTLDQRRAVLGLVVEKIIVKPGKPGRPRLVDGEVLFDGDRVEVRWAA